MVVDCRLVTAMGASVCLSVCLSVYTSVQVESLSLLHIVVGLSSSSSSLSAVVDDGRRRQNLVIKPF